MLGEVTHRHRAGRAGADDEADLGLEVEPPGRPERRAVCPAALAARAGDRGTGRHDRARPAVIADRHVLPIRRERLAVRPEYPPGVGRVVLVAEEVDVVPRRERQMHPHRGQRAQRGLGGPAVPLVLLAGGEQFGDPGPRLGPSGPALRHEGVQRRLAEHLVAQRPGEVQDRVTDPDPDPGAVVLALHGEDAVGQVGRPVRRPGRQVGPAGGGQALSLPSPWPPSPWLPSPGPPSPPLRWRMVSPT